MLLVTDGSFICTFSDCGAFVGEVSVQKRHAKKVELSSNFHQYKALGGRTPEPSLSNLFCRQRNMIPGSQLLNLYYVTSSGRDELLKILPYPSSLIHNTDEPINSIENQNLKRTWHKYGRCTNLPILIFFACDKDRQCAPKGVNPTHRTHPA